MAQYFAKKSLESILGHAQGEHGLKRTLGAGNLVALGIGAIIGAGLFVRTAAASGQHAGNAVTISFLVAALGCAFAGLCYAEFASMIPIAGSAYTYAYATMGELVAWVIGWALILEYALGAATVSIAWSEYLNNLLGKAHEIPPEWCHSPWDTTPGYVNLPALFILLALTVLLIRGTQESALINSIIVFIKVAIVLVFIFVGWNYIVPANHLPYILDPKTIENGGKILIGNDLSGQPAYHDYHDFWNHGWGGIFRGAAVVFFAFIGFDAVSTAAQEAKNPKRDMPIGILGSLAVCTILYVLFAHVLTGVAPFTDFIKPGAGKEASVTYAIKTYMTEYAWLGDWINVAILAGFSSVILVMLMGQARVFYSMSNDGLLPATFSELHPKFRTPYKSNMLLFIFVGLFAGFVPGNLAGDLTSFGTLLAFVLVCIGIIIMRKASPDVPRPFRTPLVPLVPILGAVVCTLMILSLNTTTLMSAMGWMVVGVLIYFTYSIRHSKVSN